MSLYINYTCTLCKYQAFYCTLCKIIFIKLLWRGLFMIKIEQIQKNLREAIANSSMSKKELAQKLGINPSTISKYLHEDKYPAIETLANICQILDVSADYILCLKEY